MPGNGCIPAPRWACGYRTAPGFRKAPSANRSPTSSTLWNRCTCRCSTSRLWCPIPPGIPPDRLWQPIRPTVRPCPTTRWHRASPSAWPRKAAASPSISSGRTRNRPATSSRLRGIRSRWSPGSHRARTSVKSPAAHPAPAARSILVRRSPCITAWMPQPTATCSPSTTTDSEPPLAI